MLVIQPKAEILKGVLLSFKKRHKTMKKKGYLLTCQRVIQETERNDLELLEIECTYDRGADFAVLRLLIWEDGWVVIRSREARKNGIAWKWSEEGRVFGEEVGKNIVNAFERSLSTWFKNDASLTLENLSSIWLPLLAKGPKAIDK